LCLQAVSARSDSTLRVAYLSQSAIPSREANSVHAMKMCDALADVGSDVTLVARRGDEVSGLNPYQFYGVSRRVRLVLFPRRSSILARMLFSLLGVVRVWRSGVTHAIGRDLTGCYFAALFGLSVSYETHEPAARYRGVKRIVFTRLVNNRNFRRLVVITATLRDDYQSEFGIARDRILLAPDAASEPDATVLSLGGEGKLLVGYVGQLYPGKGMELIVPLAKRCTWADFHVVGGREEDVAYWRDRARDLTNLHFHGFVPHALTDRYRNAVDVLLAPFQRRITIAGEGDISSWTSPLKVFEYMAARKPILCSDLAVLREVMRDGGNCILLPPDDVEAWRDALIRLRDDPGLRSRLAANAYSDFLERYTWKSRAARVVATMA
jgi:glycosyltransferase involved in cell wall biosynthesis